jgi:hypothetical protein
LVLEGLLEDFVALVDAVVANLSVSNEDDVGEPLFGDDLGHVFGRGAAGTSFGDDTGLELLFGGEVAVGVPEVVVGDIFTVFDDDVVNCFPVVGAVAN